MQKKVLVVGAGFAGAVIARELAEKGFSVDVIDRRDHIAGNAFDEEHAITGCRYHKYGPHIFHTNDVRIFDYLSQFTEWLPYQHKVEAFVENIGDVPMPINLTTLNTVYSKNLKNENDILAFLDGVRVENQRPSNAYEHLLAVYGENLTELFFARYTQKMWGLSLKELPVSVVARIPVRMDSNPYYFNDKFQFMPKNGYEALFKRMLDHKNIKVSLNVEFDKCMEHGYYHTFNSMPIDVYFEQRFGELPYRSIKFEHRVGESFPHQVPTVNFTDEEKYTRKTNWSLYPGCGGGRSDLVTYEIPCDYKLNNLERYYPVKTVDGAPQRIYQQYFDESKKYQQLTFIGRCGQYIYYDMHQVVANSLSISRGIR